MNDRVPHSSRLPLRAMVMVLLFLGVVFLLVALQAVNHDNSGSDSSPTTSATSSAAPTTSEAPAPRAEVRVFNISEVAGAADRTAGRLRDDGWTVAETGNLAAPPDVTATTVYFGEAEGEKQSAEAVGKLLNAPVAPRIPELAEQPPGVVVLVTG